MRPDELIAAIDRTERARLKAIFNVHLGGQCDDLKEIYAIAKSNGVALIDDACHAIGTTYRDPSGEAQMIGCGQLVDLTAFSFHPVKTVAMGEGGAVTTNDPALAARIRSLRSHGMTRNASEFAQENQAYDAEGNLNPWYYEQHELGLNYRATDIQCALGSSQLQKVDRFLQVRRDLSEEYENRLQELAPAVIPRRQTGFSNPGWHLFVALFDWDAIGKSRAEFMKLLHNKGIGTQVHYIPVHQQPYYKSLYGEQILPGAEKYYDACLSLPLHADMTSRDVERVVNTISSLL